MSDPPRVFIASPRKLPKPAKVPGRVAVLDIAFAAEGTGTSFEKVTAPFLQGLGDRLAAWVDHHDHALHPRFASDPRFVLATKAQHGACPEMITPALVARVGEVHSVVCHGDVDGLMSAAKWIRGGVASYPEADDDARAIDTRVGEMSPRGALLDRALRARSRDEVFGERVVRWLVDMPAGDEARAFIDDAASEYAEVEARTAALASRYVLRDGAAWCDVGDEAPRGFDKTELLLRGQRLATVAVVLDAQNVTLAAPFDSGVNFLTLLGIDGGMPTVVSVPRSRLDDVRAALRRPAKGLPPEGERG